MSWQLSRAFGSSTVLAVVLSLGSLRAEETQERAASLASTSSVSPVHRVFKLPTPEAPASVHRSDDLKPVLKMAVAGYKQMRARVKDYSCILVRRERVDDRLGPHEFIFAKVRHRELDGNQVVVPFSVYLRFLKPSSVAGREVLYVEGKNNGEMFARRGGKRFSFVTTRLSPNSELAMTGNRYPVTEFGIENLLYRLIQSAKLATQRPCEVKYLPEAKINGRSALGIVVVNKEESEDLPFKEARIFVDNELQVPLHYESYGWPEDDSEESPLLEQYTYTKLQLNPGFSDTDFSEDNPEYHVK